MDALVFYISGLISVAAAILVVTRRNPVYSTVYLVLFFIMISLDFLILRAPFLAIVQVLVYGGAIMVLFLFVIMLLNLAPEELLETVPRGRRVLSGAASLLIFLLLAVGIRLSPTVRSAQDLTLPPQAPAPGAADLRNLGETAAIGESLFTTHTLAFEYASILILVAILGAIYLTKKKPTAARHGVTPGLVPVATPRPPPVAAVGVGPPAQREGIR